MKITVFCTEAAQDSALLFADINGLQVNTESLERSLDESDYVLAFSENGVELWFREKKKPVSLRLDFAGGSKDHRRKYGGGKGQAIAKAIGLGSTKHIPSILDATAGQGSDAFVLASLGCSVTMIERSAIARCMLKDAIRRAKIYAVENDQELTDILSRLNLVDGDFLAMDADTLPQADIIYLDPMFPERKKSALVKKEMRVFHDIIGKDEDSDGLLPKALELAGYRVVVKRPLVAPYLNSEQPTYQLKGKSSRFDIYVNKSMKDLSR